MAPNDNMFDMNEAESFRGRGVIPHNTYARLKMHLRPGDVQGPEPSDGLILKQSKDGETAHLDAEFTLVTGPHAKQKMWQTMTVVGGKTDEKGVSIAWNITKSMLRSMVDSCLGLSPDDNSEEAKMKRRFKGFRDFEGIEFAARVDVQKGGVNRETGGEYPDKNIIGAILTVKDPHYQAVMQGQAVAAGTAAAPTTAPAAGGKPAWQKDAPAPAAQAQAVQQPVNKPKWVTG